MLKIKRWQQMIVYVKTDAFQIITALLIPHDLPLENECNIFVPVRFCNMPIYNGLCAFAAGMDYGFNLPVPACCLRHAAGQGAGIVVPRRSGHGRDNHLERIDPFRRY